MWYVSLISILFIGSLDANSNSSFPGQESVYTFPVSGQAGVVAAPEAVADSINLIIRSDVELIAAALSNSISVAVVPKKLGELPIGFGPFYMRQDKGQDSSLKLIPSWLSQFTLSVDKPLQPLGAPQSFIYPQLRLMITPEVHSLVINNASAFSDSSLKIIILRSRVESFVLFSVLVLVTSVALYFLYLFYRLKSPKAEAKPVIPQWARELKSLPEVPSNSAAWQLHKLVCDYLAFKENESVSGKTLEDFIGVLEKRQPPDLKGWQELNRLLEEVLYDDKQVFYTKALGHAKELITQNTG